MNILSIPLDRIEAGDRLRDIDPAWAVALADSMAEHGQMTAIEVAAVSGGRYLLVAGGHRLAALQMMKAETADAVVVKGSELELRLREIDENLFRHELTQLDRSTFLAQRKAVYEALHPETKHGGDHSKSKTQNLRLAFAADAAERLGFSERSVTLAITRYSRLAPEARKLIAGTWLADHGSQLDALGKLPGSLQLRVAELLRADPDVKSVTAAVASIEGREAPAPDPLSDQFEAFLRLWKRMPEAVRRRVRQQVNAKEKP